MNELELKKFANQIRVETLKSLVNLGFGHFGGSLSIVETLAVLYGKVMNLDLKIHNGLEETILYYQKGMQGPLSTLRLL